MRGIVAARLVGDITDFCCGIIQLRFRVLLAPVLDDQYTAEVFYRFMLSRHFAITPDLQYIKYPALNPNDSSIWIAGIRVRLTL